jgi:hypothetical protein
MKLSFLTLALSLIISPFCAQNSPYKSIPERETAYPSLVFELNDELKLELLTAPVEGNPNRASEISFVLPLPNGSSVTLSAEYAPIIAPGLAAKYPEIRSYLVKGEGCSGRIGYTYKGFHGILFTDKGTVYYDALNASSNEYHCYYRNDYMNHFRGTKDHRCLVDEDDQSLEALDIPEVQRGGRSGEQLRTYRLALACTGEYASFHGGTVSGALSAMVVTMNRVNGVYEREFAVRMVIIDNNDDIIFLDGNTDPYTNNSGSAMLGENQSTCTSIIGSSNYDMGHVFSTGGGGIASLRSVCSFQNKAKGVTGGSSPTGDPFDIDYVAHEMGHQFGGNHTQNNNCNRSQNHAYEPGSASTIMGYAGICSPNLQGNSDDYFHTHTWSEVTDFIINGNGNGCATTTNTGNAAPVVTVPNGGFFIPIETPFLLEGSATDANGDDLTYCWEQYDLGPTGSPDSPSGDAPIFRSWDPKEESYRVCPQLVNIIIGNTVFGETYPTYDRNLSFRLTVRDENTSGGGVGFDLIEFEASEDAGPFLVTSPSQGESVEALNGYEITWDVANTDQAPVNCQNVNIELCSYNSGTQSLTILDTLALNTPNDGSETVFMSVDNVGGGKYIRVKAADNIFFNLNGGAFSIAEPSELEDVSINLTLTPHYDSVWMELNWNDDFTNESAWYVEKSTGTNQSFILIDSMPANSTMYRDTNVIMYGEVYYYRVYAKNAISVSGFSNEVVYEGLSIAEINELELTVFPNPSSGVFYISGMESRSIRTIKIIDMHGRSLPINSQSQTGAYSIQTLASGWYWLEVIAENERKSILPIQVVK